MNEWRILRDQKRNETFNLLRKRAETAEENFLFKTRMSWGGTHKKEKQKKKSPECYLFHFIVHRVECDARGENVQNKRTHHPKRLTHFSDGSWARDIWEWEFSASSEASERSLRIYWEFPLSTDSTAFVIELEFFGNRLGKKYRKEEMNEKTTQSQMASSTSETPRGLFSISSFE